MTNYVRTTGWGFLTTKRERTFNEQVQQVVEDAVQLVDPASLTNVDVDNISEGKIDHQEVEGRSTEHRTERDALTGLLNRRSAIELVDRLLSGATRERVAVVFGDLDDFGRINSSLGYEVGDELLRRVARRLEQDLPVGCTAARLSGDEFVVVCDDFMQAGGSDELARSVAGLLRSTTAIHDRQLELSASVGLATSVELHSGHAVDLLKYAEEAMRDAKRRNKYGGIGIATSRMVSTAMTALELEAELNSALAQGSLSLDYQQIIGRDKSQWGAEALVRWLHPERGVIEPRDFLAVADRAGLMRNLDLWVLQAAASEAVNWTAIKGSSPSIAVNLGGLLPSDDDFVEIIIGILARTGLRHQSLILELSETALVAATENELKSMKNLVALGVRFALDGFGTGYSSLTRLKDLPAQIIKIAPDFIAGVADDPIDFSVARAVITMAKAMGRQTIAEGVETVEQYETLKQLDVDAYQGWYISKPVTSAEIRERFTGATPV